ncbi:MAG: sialate O-acetylesterase, partial [Rikenellaceae bacterium]|nr:sialate O-acetylesterase [Rikenellaceae bacterium]
MKKFILMISSVALCTLAVNAKVKLSGAIGDNMVLQRQSQASIWGWADAGKSVSVHTSWNSKSYSAKADKDGKWLVKVATPDAGGPYTIKISDGQPVTLSNVMIGEVWVCSGQSNMEMRMAGNSGQPIDGALDAILTAGKYRDRVRVITVPRNSTKELQEDILPNAK